MAASAIGSVRREVCEGTGKEQKREKPWKIGFSRPYATGYVKCWGVSECCFFVGLIFLQQILPCCGDGWIN